MRKTVVGIWLCCLLMVASRGAIATESVWTTAGASYDIDPVVLYALALQESRRMRPDGTVRPWPWTLHAPPIGALYFDSYAEAADKVLEIIDSGVDNVDIGMMQINWRSNGHLLPDPAAILKPENNVQLGAYILRRELDAQQGNLSMAIARYHTPFQSRGEDYAAKVLRIIDNLRSLRGLPLALSL